ncbi:MAG TPA: two-component regulator propeller domain-containing protein [Panacibacter sp.]|nr:two-component regulator propeller domain-containing protein [Panacibacter sp.]
MVYAQLPGTKLYTLTPDNYQPISIKTLYQVKQGYIFVGTTNGLYRFDGINFIRCEQSPDIPDTVTAICEIPGQEILIGFSNGNIGRLIDNNRIELLPFEEKTPDDINTKENKSPEIIRYIEEGFPKAAITKILADGNNVIWFATAGDGLWYYRNNIFSRIDDSDGLSDNYVYDISLQPLNHIVASTDNGINLCSADENNKVIKTFTSRNGLFDNIVRCLFTTSASYVWLGMQDGGIQYYDTESPPEIQPASWQYGQVNAVIPVSSQVFVATEEKGLLVYNSNTDNHIALQYQDYRMAKISCLLKDREGNLWAAGNNQLMQTAGTALDPVYKFKSDSFEDLHTLLYAKNGDLWFNKKQKLIKLSKTNDTWKEQEYVIKSIAAQSDITSLYQDESGIIWIGTMGSGLIILDPLTGKHRTIIEDSLLINGSILSISGKNGTIWIASLEGAVSCKATGLGNGIDQKFQCSNYADDKSLGSKYVYDILTDSKNRVWFATDGKGVSLLENDQFIHYNKQDGIQNEVVYKIAEDSQGYLWFSTNTKGIIEYDGTKFKGYGLAQGLTDLNITSLAASGSYLLAAHKSGIDLVNIHNGNISYLDDEQGLENINTDPNTFSNDNQGNIYFAAGYTIYKYKPPSQQQFKPFIVIDKIQLFLKDTLIKNGQSFGADENNISFYYTGLFYSQPGKIQYQFKLEGYMNEWKTTKDRVQNFPRLPPGFYKFKVRVSLNQNFTDAPEASFSFTIEEPFWKQLWFILLAAFLLAGTLFFIIKQRESGIEKFNRLEREKIQLQLQTLRNQINPHFLFNSFNTLISEIEDNPDKAVVYVEHLSDFYRNIVMHKEKDYISLEEEINILNDYFFIQQKRFGKALQITMTISLEQQKIYFVVPLALQLLFENAVKHNVVSTDTPLHIELFINDAEQLVVRNNIMVKFQAEKGSSLGLQNIQKRYELLCGKSVIVENDTFFFTVKIPLLKQ